MLAFLASRSWSPADFPVQKSGAVRLQQPALARVTAALAAATPADLTHVTAWMANAIRQSTNTAARRSSPLGTRNLSEAAIRQR